MNTFNSVFYDPENKRQTFDARVKTATQRGARAVQNYFSLREERVPPAWAAEKSFLPSPLKDSRRLGKGASKWPSRLDFKLALRTLPNNKKRSNYSHEGCKYMTSVPGYGTARESALAGSPVKRAN